MKRIVNFNQKFALLTLVLAFVSCKTDKDSQNNSHKTQLKTSTIESGDWLFEKTADYNAMSSSYKGPNWLLKGVNIDDSGYGDHAESSEISADGRYIVFSSEAQLTTDAPRSGTKLYRCVANQDGAGSICGRVELISRRPSTTIKTECGDLFLPAMPANGDFIFPSISADGNRVAFIAKSPDLMPETMCDITTDKPVIMEDSLQSYEVYLADLTANTVEKVSGKEVWDADYGGTNQLHLSYDKPAISLDGKVVAFVAKMNAFEHGVTPPAENDGAFKQVFLYNSLTKKTGWASLPTMPALPVGKGGDSTNPQLNYDGSIVVFKSFAKLTPEDQTNNCTSDNKIPNVYMAKFMMNATLGLEITKRTSLELVSVDKDSDKSTGCGGSSYPTITSDGRFVMFMSTKAPSEIADIRINDTSTPDPKNVHTQVYLRDMTTKQTALVGLAQFQERVGGKSFSEITDNVGYPTISANGKYALITTAAKNVYMNTKMKRFLDKEIVAPAKNDCASLVIFGSEHKSFMWINDLTSTSGEFTRAKVDSGWRDAQAADCLPALHPNNWGKTQVYRLTLNNLQVTSVDPMSVTPPLAISTWYTDYDPTKKIVEDGKNIVLSSFGRVYQIHYGNLNSTSGLVNSTSRLINDDGTAVFYSASGNLRNVEDDFSGYRTNSGYYKVIPPEDINYVFSENAKDYQKYFEDDPYYPFYPAYNGRSMSMMSTFVYPSSQITKMER